MRVHSIEWLLIALAVWSSPLPAIAQQHEPATFPATQLAPYTAFAWSGPSLGGPKRISPLIWVDTKALPGLVARRLNALPPGKRVLFVWHAQEQIWGDPKDAVPATVEDGAVASAPKSFQSPWLDHGAAIRAAGFGSLLDGVKKAGATVDFLVTDAEVGLPMWAIQPPQIRAIGADPRFAVLAKQFKISDLSQVGALQHWDACSAWNEAMDSTIAAYFRSAYTGPLLARFPDAGYSEFGDMLLPAALADRAHDLNGWVQPSVGPLYGTHQSPAMYGQIRQLAIAGRNDGTNPDFAKDPLATIAWQVGVMRALVAGSSNPILPWFCHRSWTGDSAGNTPLAGTPYWNELFYHCMLSGNCVDCLFWNPKAPPSDMTAMDDVLKTLETETRNSPTLISVAPDAIPFDAKIIVSGSRCADGHKLFRITVMPGVTSATVTLPGESASRVIDIPAGQVGTWVTEP